MAFQFNIQLMDVDDPPVWRRVVVPEKFSFWKFHLVIQEAFGWWNSHLFQFSPKGWNSQPAIGLKLDAEPDEDVQDCKKIKLSQIFNKEGQTYTYIYDFGDNWLHAITLEKITADKPLKASCIDGAGKCPPEDCGGYPGYEELKKVLADATHPEHGEMKEWLGLSKRQQWNPHAFDLKKTQAAVQQV